MAKRIYIGGEFFSGGGTTNPDFPVWDPSTLTPDALKLMKRYWGISTDTSISGSQMQALPNHAVVSSNEHNVTFVTSGGYLYYALPLPLGAPTLYVNGFLNTAWQSNQVTVTENGISVIYVIYRSLYIQNGTNIILKIDRPL